MKHLIITAIILSAILMGTRALAAQEQLRRNPFAPLAQATAPKTPEADKSVDKDKALEDVKLELNGIIWSKNKPVAIINNTVVEIGSEIAGQRVSAISTMNVELEYQGRKKTLKIAPKVVFSITGNKSDKKTMFKTGQ